MLQMGLAPQLKSDRKRLFSTECHFTVAKINLLLKLQAKLIVTA